MLAGGVLALPNELVVEARQRGPYPPDLAHWLAGVAALYDDQADSAAFDIRATPSQISG